MPDELLPIHGCENTNRVADVVFVHGLNGNAREYWCYEGKPENFWPAWLSEALSDVGVWSLGYENAAFQRRRLSLLRRSAYRGFAMPLSDRAKSVLLHLEVARLGERPLVFIGHSMGGLLVKQLLRTANDNSAQKSWTAILKNTRGVCFIATPHVGSDLAKWASYFRTILGTNVSTRELEPHGSPLRELNEFYRNFVAKKGVNIKTLSFFETKPVFGDTLVVAEGDADPGIAWAGLYALGEDHFSICKPRSKSEPIHMRLVDFIANDCLQLAAPQSLSPAQTNNPLSHRLGPPWHPSPLHISRLWTRPTAISVIAAAVIVVGILYRAMGPPRRIGGPDRATTATIPTPVPDAPPTLLFLDPPVLPDSVANSNDNPNAKNFDDSAIIINETKQRLRLWMYPRVGRGDEAGWRTLDLAPEPQEYPINVWRTGLTYFKVQNIDEPDDLFISNHMKIPYDQGWRPTQHSSSAIRIRLRGRFSAPESPGATNSLGVLRIEYVE